MKLFHLLLFLSLWICFIGASSCSTLNESLYNATKINLSNEVNSLERLVAKVNLNDIFSTFTSNRTANLSIQLKLDHVRSSPEFDYDLFSKDDTIYLLSAFGNEANFKISLNVSCFAFGEVSTKRITIDYTVLKPRFQIKHIFEFTVSNVTLDHIFRCESRLLDYLKTDFWMNEIKGELPESNDKLSIIYIKPSEDVNRFKIGIGSEYGESVDISYLLRSKRLSGQYCAMTTDDRLDLFANTTGLTLDLCTIKFYPFNRTEIDYLKRNSQTLNYTLDASYTIELYNKLDLKLSASSSVDLKLSTSSSVDLIDSYFVSDNLFSFVFLRFLKLFYIEILICYLVLLIAFFIIYVIYVCL